MWTECMKLTKEEVDKAIEWRKKQWETSNVENVVGNQKTKAI